MKLAGYKQLTTYMPYWVLGRNANWFHVDPLVIRTRTATVGVRLFGAEVDMHLNMLIYT